ncbi:MAG TPA: hypothetical protein VF532_01730 [Candidatus Angelobacter sp.]
MPQDNHARFVRALLFGIGGFAIGLALYAGFVIATGISIGYIALAVGWIVGKAMMMGSGGVGGKRYQVAAVLLTYAAVSMAYVPILIHFVKKERAERPQIQQTQRAAATDTGSAEPAPSQGPAAGSVEKPSLAGALGMLALWGLASPFLRLSGNPMAFIGLIILFVGMQFAWKMTAGSGNVVITGPFEKPAAASA